jgi:hypothetical protein
MERVIGMYIVYIYIYGRRRVNLPQNENLGNEC